MKTMKENVAKGKKMHVDQPLFQGLELTHTRKMQVENEVCKLHFQPLAFFLRVKVLGLNPF